MSESDLKAEVIAFLDTQAWDTTWADVKLESTILPARAASSVDLESAVDDLPVLTQGLEELAIGRVVGEGGMGVVHLAEQRSLDRTVAVKRLKPDQRTTKNVHRLVREARLTGWLEHPNIIPVYVLGRDTDGSVLFAMKRIGGTPWTHFFEQPQQAAERSQVDDPLDFHLDVLMQVCQAVHFAHSKGVVHRDIKPENVMVGDFGEVYLLDWGIACRVGDRAAASEPRSDEPATPSGQTPAVTERALAGTPVMMAPEMVAGDVAALSPRTDVYLLGAVLHLILTGRPRHRGDSLPEVLVSALSSEPFAYPDSVPAELAAIANRSMAADPSDRYESAEAMRRAIADYRRHRGSDRLCREARVRLEELRDLTSLEQELDRNARQRLYSRFAECRFGFQQALAEWEGNAQALHGLQEAMERMIDVEIRRGAFNAAAGLLAELPAPNPELEARVDELGRSREHDQAEVERLRKIRRSIDVGFGARTRSAVCLWLALLWGVPDTIIGVLEVTDRWQPSYAFLVARTVAFSAILGLAAWVKREALLGNVANRRIIGSALILMANQLLIWIVGWRLAISLDSSASTTTVSFAVITALMAATIDPRIWLASAFMLAGAIGCIASPGFAFGWLGLSAVSGLVALAWVWRVPNGEAVEARADRA